MARRKQHPKAKAIAYADVHDTILKRVVLMKRGDSDWGVRRIFVTGDSETDYGMLNPAAYDLACKMAGTRELKPCAAGINR